MPDQTNIDLLFDFASNTGSVVHYIARREADVQFDFIGSNIEALTGHPARSFTEDQDMMRSIVSKDDQAIFDRRSQLEKSDGFKTFSYRITSSEGHIVHVRDECRVTLKGSHEYLVGCLVPEMRNAASDHVQEYIEQAIAVLPSGFAVYDAQGRLIVVNEAVNRLYGFEKNELVGMQRKDMLSLMIPRIEQINGEKATGTPEQMQELDHLFRTLDNGTIELKLLTGQWRLLTCHPTHDGGQVIVSVDITNAKLAEMELRQSEALVRRVLENCPLPITMSRLHGGEILYESPASKRLLLHEEINGADTVLSRWVDLSKRDKCVEMLQARGVIDGIELEFKKPDGSIFWGIMSARLIEYMDEEIVVSCTIDQTDRRALDDEVRRQRDALHQSEKLSALGELLAGVSHELNNPLSVLVGQSLLLKETAQDPDVIDRAAKIGNAADRCARIVKSFLAMARQEPLEKTDVSLNAIVENALEITAHAARRANIQIRSKLATDLPLAFADPDQLTQVVINLIVNAQHALNEISTDRVIDIETGWNKKGGKIFLQVADNGPGVPQEARHRIFEPLYTTKEVGKGTGIGLALCHRIVSSHGGNIFLNSNTGPGASFIVQLPLTAKEDTAGGIEIQKMSQVKQLNVLVVDDEREVAALICEILETDGHKTQTASSGQEALATLASRKFDLVLSDLRMPDMDGPGLYRRLSEEQPEMAKRIAFITGDTMGPVSAKFLKASERPFIEKPITPSDIRSLVQKLAHTGKA